MNYKLLLETGSLARLANASCRVSLGDTSVLCTTVSKTPEKLESGELLLSVIYKNSHPARPNNKLFERDVLTGRMIDRSLRSSFPKYFYNPTQLVCDLISDDGLNNPDVLAINGASASLALSDVSWNGPIAAVRVGLFGEKDYICFPTRKQLKESVANLVISANKYGNIVMLDGSFEKPIGNKSFKSLLKYGISECKTIIEDIEKLRETYGKTKQPLISEHKIDEQIRNEMRNFIEESLVDVFNDHFLDKYSRHERVKVIQDSAKCNILEKYPDLNHILISECFVDLMKELYANTVFKTKVRCDGRKETEIRKINCKVDLHEPLHGSSLFQRGQTQVFCSCTYDSIDSQPHVDYMTSTIAALNDKNFSLQYEFPQYAVGEFENKRGSAPDRREIGHGALAEKALIPVVPENHPYAIRLKCKVLESNGSSSMASVCAGSMALMDAGLDIKEPVAGVAIGLLKPSLCNDNKDEQFIVLTDILGLEDFLGLMDFKVAGTRKGVTAVQLDNKLQEGIALTTLSISMHHAESARNRILSFMEKAIPEARKQQKNSHPVMKTIHISAQHRSKFVGSTGSNIKRMRRDFGVVISEYIPAPDETFPGELTQPNYLIYAPSKDAYDEFEEYLNKLLDSNHATPNLEFGAIYTATITEIRDSGLMIILYPGMRPTLLKMKEIDIKKVHDMSALDFVPGQQIQVKYFGTDPVTGGMRISRRAIQMTSVARKYDYSTP